jgi:hypothetical protein
LPADETIRGGTASDQVTRRVRFALAGRFVVLGVCGKETAVNVAMVGLQRESNRGLVRWLVAGAAAVALFVAVLLHSAPVGAAEPDSDLVYCNGGVTNYCPNLIGFAGNNYGWGWGWNGWYGYPTTFGYRQYTDNRSNCPDGQVTQSGAGYFCTNYGVPAFVVNNGNYIFPYVNGYWGNWGFGYAGFTPWWGFRPGVPYTGVVRVAEVSAPVQVPAADPQPAPAAQPVVAPVAAPAAPASAVTQVAPAPQPAPAQVATSMAAAQEPAAPQAPLAQPLSAPTGGSGLGTTVQGTSTAVVAAPAADPGNDDHRG